MIPKSSDLILKPSDLPGSFPVSHGEQLDDTWSQLYFNPQPIHDAAGRGMIFGVKLQIAVLESIPAAQARLRESGDEASSANVADRLLVNAGDADEMSAFVSEYEIEQVPVCDFTFRFRMANAVGQLVVSARGPDAPAGEAVLQAERLLRRQLEIIREARQ